MKKLMIAALALLVIAGGAGGLFLLRVNTWLDRPLERATTFTVDKGGHLRGVIDQLTAEGVIVHPTWLYAWARWNDRTAIRTGRYELRAEQSPADLIAMLEKGVVQTASFTIAEGLNRWQIRDLLAEANWIDKKTFEGLCDDQEFLAAHRIPGPSCDGYFFPETYTFAVGIEAKRIFARVFEVYRKNFEEATAKGRGPRDFSEREMVTFASIVEKETGAPEERPHIACVFYNRLAANPPWRMETDPTVIYAATLENPDFDGNIRYYHLRRMENPYNTYKNYGLPPGPIASPGRAAFDAVVNPAECKDFFFVSMNNGRHLFCPTLECHEAGVDRYQRRRR